MCMQREVRLENNFLLWRRRLRKRKIKELRVYVIFEITGEK